MKKPTHHFVIPDTQAKAGVPFNHLEWIGRYIVEKQPDVIIHLGDHWDMPSLSHWDRGKMKFEGRRYKLDVESGNAAFDLLNAPIRQYNKRHLTKYNPRKVFLMGNHEFRLETTIQENPILDGQISYADLDTQDWEVYPYQQIVFIDGIGYVHCYVNTMTGRPLGGMAATRLKTIGHSFTQGHQQTLDYAIRFVAGKSQHGLIAGACYLHDEEYKGYQGNAHWRGVIVKHDVKDGSYNPMMVDLEYLCRKYEGIGLDEFINKKLKRPSNPFGEWGV